MAMMGNAQPVGPTSEWMTMNGTDVNVAHITSIQFDTGQGILAIVYLSNYDSLHPAPNVTSFEVKDAQVANVLRAYIDARRTHRP